MLSDAEVERVAAARGQGVRLVVHAGADAELGAALAGVARQLAGAAVGVAAGHGDGAGLVATPALTVVNATGDNATWSAAPDGPEAGPFAEHLAALLGGERPQAWAATLAGLDDPVELLVFVAPACPHCPNAVRVALAAARASSKVRVHVIDVQRHPELAARFRVTAVPVTVVDRGVALTGVRAGDDLVRRIEARADPGALFASWVESGRLDEAAELLTRDPAPMASAWRSSTTSTRIGLMLVAEKALERDPRSLDAVAGDLAAGTRSDDTALRGDTADLLGQIGAPVARPALAALLDDPSPDVVEIAADALDSLRSD